jgi:hypothetical protein
MAAPKKYPDGLRERAVRLTLEARKDPATAVGAIKRVADQLGVHSGAARVGQAPRERCCSERHFPIEEPTNHDAGQDP